MALTLRDIVIQAVSEVSRCWEPQPSGTFDDERALIVVNALMKVIEEYRHFPQEEPPGTMTVEFEWEGKRYKGSIPCIGQAGGDSNAH